MNEYRFIYLLRSLRRLTSFPSPHSSLVIIAAWYSDQDETHSIIFFRATNFTINKKFLLMRG